jgi:hypothetical protein
MAVEGVSDTVAATAARAGDTAAGERTIANTVSTRASREPLRRFTKTPDLPTGTPIESNRGLVTASGRSSRSTQRDHHMLSNDRSKFATKVTIQLASGKP